MSRSRIAAAVVGAALLMIPAAAARAEFSDVVRVMDAINTQKRLACDAPAPECCGAGASEGCTRAAATVPAFDVVMASAS